MTLSLARVLKPSALLAFPLLAWSWAWCPPVLAAQPKTQLIWEAWYTVLAGGKIPYSYYTDRVEVRNGKLSFQNRVWKREEDFINEEQLGAFAENTPELKPLFFNFHSTYRTNETMIDGTFKDKLLTVKIRKGGKELPIVKKSVSAKSILSAFFPLWISRKLPELKPGKSLSFMAIQEDDPEQGFSVVAGRVTLEKPDDLALKTKTRKLKVEFRGIQSYWWVDDQGIAARIEMPRQKITVERVTREKAVKFLD